MFKKLISFYHYFLNFFWALFCGFPSKKITLIGVTGTKGKTSVCDFLVKIFDKANIKNASINSLYLKTDKEIKKNLFKMTMPGRGFLQRFLKKALIKGCKVAIIEVTSEGILQHRQKFLDFDALIFTNLSPEHIERHGSFLSYKKAKGKLFSELKFSSKKRKKIFVNLDDKFAKYFLSFFADEKWATTTKEKLPDFFYDLPLKENIKVVQAKILEVSEKGTFFEILGKKIHLKLLGDFFVENASLAVACALSFGVSFEVIKEALEEVQKVPGRMEIVSKKPLVIVDYAHTPKALIEVYQNLKKIFKKDLICVLGCAGGGRDRWKRQVMGRIADNFCKKIFLTNEDPYDEDPEKILEDIEKGISNKKKVLKILDRKEAIKKALLSSKDEVVMITGKGAEPWMCLKKGKKIPWDDREIVKINLNLFHNF